MGGVPLAFREKPTAKRGTVPQTETWTSLLEARSAGNWDGSPGLDEAPGIAIASKREVHEEGLVS